MKIAILGAGAMGCLLASYLCGHNQIWLIDGWNEQIETITQSGLLRERDGQQSLHYPQASSDPACAAPCDIALVLVKSSQTAWAAEQASRLGAALVITLQNGLGNRELLAERLGNERVSQGVTSLGATLLAPGKVRHAGLGSTIFAHTSSNDVLQTLVQRFNDCGLPAELSDNLDSIIWGKLIVNVGINALTALLRVPNGTLASIPEARSLLAQAVTEGLAVAKARGIVLPYDDAVAHVLGVAQATATNRSSMLQDVLRGSPTEIAMINGAVLRAGRELGIATPVNELLTNLVSALDAASSVGEFPE